jgi:hypothetical protein
MRLRDRWLVLGLVLALCPAPRCSAYFIDPNHTVDVRLRAYSQLGIMTDSSEKDWPTGAGRYNSGDLAQHRNFYNPELDADLTRYVRGGKEIKGLSLITPDDFKFHFAWWGFYDGIYDYMNEVWDRNRRVNLARWSQSDNPELDSIKFNDENKNPRHIYGRQNRINELYIDYTKGPLFLRVGRQAISWGESDDIALLDVQNPFDLTQGAPGFFQDIEEARIPLYTVRSTVKLVDNWRWLSSFFLDTYLVPGPIDTTVPIDPIAGGGVSPFAPDLLDPQTTAIPAAQQNLLHVVTVSRLPQNTWANSRWGARLTGVVANDYTVQGWFFRTFNQQPIPVLKGPPGGFALAAAGDITLIDDRGFRVAECFDASGNPIKQAAGSTGKTAAGRTCSWAAPVLTILERRLESVVGLAGTWYSPKLGGIMRTEAEFFIDEPSFKPQVNLNPQVQNPLNKSVGANHLPTANYLRGLIGYDRFFFFRPLNPSSSFTWVNAFHFQWNTSAGGFRNPYPKPGHPQTELGRVPGVPGCEKPPFGIQCQVVNPKDFENQYSVDNLFLQTTLQTDYLHGKLEPRITMILDVQGIFGFAPSVTYRINDSFLFSGTYLAIEGSRRAGLAVFRGHDMVQLRLTYQLN